MRQFSLYELVLTSNLSTRCNCNGICSHGSASVQHCGPNLLDYLHWVHCVLKGCRALSPGCVRPCSLPTCQQDLVATKFVHIALSPEMPCSTTGGKLSGYVPILYASTQTCRPVHDNPWSNFACCLPVCLCCRHASYKASRLFHVLAICLFTAAMG